MAFRSGGRRKRSRRKLILTHYDTETENQRY